MNDLSAPILDTAAPATKCKGLYWRGSTTACFDYKTGNMVATRRLKFLKKKSCHGCEVCGWIFDFLYADVENDKHEYAEQCLNNIKHGKLYTYKVNTSTEWESGVTEVDEVEFVEVEEGDKL